MAPLVTAVERLVAALLIVHADGPTRCGCGHRRHVDGLAWPDHLAVLLEAVGALSDRPGAVLDAAIALSRHRRPGIEGCSCGWAVLGASWSEHVAVILSGAGVLRPSGL